MTFNLKEAHCMLCRQVMPVLKEPATTSSPSNKSPQFATTEPCNAVSQTRYPSCPTPDRPRTDAVEHARG
jgi:hypothetical protein